jgi:hypothetical protein
LKTKTVAWGARARGAAAPCPNARTTHVDERDLGVIIQNDPKCSKQCIKAVNTANRVLGVIKRTFSVRDKDIILQFITVHLKRVPRQLISISVIYIYFKAQNQHKLNQKRKEKQH